MKQFKDLAELQRVMRQCHDILRTDKPNVMEAFDEFSKILFAKLQDEMEVKQGAKEKHQFCSEFGESSENVAQKIFMLFKTANDRHREVFEEPNERISLRSATILKVVNLLSAYSLVDTSIDVKGATYEAFLETSLPVGKVIGQFFTPMEITDFCAALVEPTVKDMIVDPACGSGGFLLAALREVWKKLNSSSPASTESLEMTKIGFISDNLYGIDIDARMIRLARINLLMHTNSLLVKIKRPSKVVVDNGLLYSEKLPELKTRMASIALTNPPFGSIEFDLVVLRFFELGQGKKSRNSPILFLERCLQLLSPRGKLAIVIPDSILSGASTSDVRDLIRKESIVKAVIKLPSETFVPYGSSAESSILFLEKKDGSKGQTDVFMAEARFVGYNRVGECIGENDLPRILSLFELFQKGTHIQNEAPTVFITPKDKLLDRLDVRRYWHPTYDKVMTILSRSVYPIVQIKEVVRFGNEIVNPRKDFRGIEFRYVGLGNVESKTGLLLYDEKDKVKKGRVLISHERTKGEELKGSCQKLAPGDVIYGKLRPYLRKAAFVSDSVIPTVCSTEFIVMKPSISVDGQYLAFLLRSDIVLEQLRHLYTGMGRPRVSQRDLGNVKIPMPKDLNVQKRIAAIGLDLVKEATKKRLEAQELLKEANEVLDEFEKRLLDMLKTGKEFE